MDDYCGSSVAARDSWVSEDAVPTARRATAKTQAPEDGRKRHVAILHRFIQREGSSDLASSTFQHKAQAEALCLPVDLDCPVFAGHVD